MIPDVGANGLNQAIGRGYREGTPERDQAHPGAEGVELLLAASLRWHQFQEVRIQQRGGDHVVHLEQFQAPGVGEPGGNKANGHSGNQVKEYGQSKGQQHYQQVVPPNVGDLLYELPVDDVPANLHQDRSQDRQGNGFHNPAQAHNQGNKQQGPENTGHGSPAAGPDAYDRAQGGAGAGQAANEPGSHVTDSLAHQFLVGTVAAAGNGVSDQ